MNDLDHPFPPPIIAAWLRYATTNSEDLAAELRYWADQFEPTDGGE